MATRTPAQIRTARRNGAKSRGPKTPQGNNRSSQNALKHGLSARTTVLNSESGEEFEKVRKSYVDYFRPANPVETDLVTEMAAARWRLRRAWSHETAILDYAIEKNEPGIQKEFLHCDPLARQGLAFLKLCDSSHSLNTIDRFESRYRRMFDRALRNLLQLRLQLKNCKTNPSPPRPPHAPTPPNPVPATPVAVY
ncbi:MAG: hypothetical protein HY235_13980 [Acidobacteria bacterium]|nr:hypothetical protein [Acidobacteriota bacterium]